MYRHPNHLISTEPTAPIDTLYLQPNSPILFNPTLQQKKFVAGLRLPSLTPIGKAVALEEDRDEKPARTQRNTSAFARRKHLHQIVNIDRPNERQRRPRFYLYSHKPTQVSSAILFFLPGLMVSISEIDNAFVYVRKYEELRKRPNQNPEDPTLLMEYLHLFDKMYFCGALGNLVSIEIGHRGLEGMDKRDYGDFTTRRDSRDWKLSPGVEGRLRISSLEDVKKFSDPQVRLHCYLGTLLHEAVHAIFDLYICYKHRRCKMLERKCLDRDGHGELFVQVAISIEVATEILYKGGLSIL